MKIDCGGTKLDASGFLAYHNKMSEIQPSSAAKCFDTQLWVRHQPSKDRYEFKTNRHKHCGNFASFEMSIFTEWIRELSNGGHSAIVRVRPEDLGPRTLKIYTYPGTTEDNLMASLMSGTDTHHGTFFHGMMTFDYFNIVRTIEDLNDGSEWAEIDFPLALVVFGSKVDPDPND